MSIDQIDPEQAWDDEEPVIAEQPATWIYTNPHGQIVLRQRNEVYEDNPFVFFSIENVPKLIAALQTMLAELAAEGDLQPEPRIETRRPRTAAERQRRRRERQRNETARDGQRDSRDGQRDEPALFDG